MTGFLHLPIEIRGMIYSHLNEILSAESLEDTQEYFLERKICRSALKSLTQTCKEISFEVSPQLHRNSVFVLCRPGQERTMLSPGHNLLKQPVHIKFHNIHHLAFTLFKPLSSSGNDTTDPTAIHLNTIHTILSSRLPRLPNIMTLRLIVYYQYDYTRNQVIALPAHYQDLTGRRIVNDVDPAIRDYLDLPLNRLRRDLFRDRFWSCRMSNRTLLSGKSLVYVQLVWFRRREMSFTEEGRRDYREGLIELTEKGWNCTCGMELEPREEC